MSANTVIYKDLGVIDYKKCQAVQEEVFDALVKAKAEGGNGQEDAKTDTAMPVLFLCEHTHVYTLGKSGAESNLLINNEFLKKIGAEYYQTNRGGDITYHGPGQLVGYPVLDLDRLGLGLKDYIHGLEQTVIDTIAEFGIRGQRSDGATGVWLPADGRGGLRKISAIGVRSSRFVTMHGFSLNVAPRMEYFSYINPCGFTDRGVTSMKDELGTEPAMEDVKRIYGEKFEWEFGVRLV